MIIYDLLIINYFLIYFSMMMIWYFKVQFGILRKLFWSPRTQVAEGNWSKTNKH